VSHPVLSAHVGRGPSLGLVRSGGPTDLANAVLLCSHHHHRAHDPAYDSQRLASGDVRFNRRT
jgi:hypothetical protein